MTRKDLVETLEKAPLSPDVRQICILLVRNLEGMDPSTAKFLPYPMLMKMVEGDTSGNNLWRALTYLSTFEYAILNAHGYILGTYGEILPLEDDEFFEFTMSGDLVHPITGDLMEDAKRAVYPYFSLVDTDDTE